MNPAQLVWVGLDGLSKKNTETGEEEMSKENSKKASSHTLDPSEERSLKELKAELAHHREAIRDLTKKIKGKKEKEKEKVELAKKGKVLSRIAFTERDRLIVETLAHHRFLTSDQIGKFCFPDAGERRVRRRLLQLCRHELVKREKLAAPLTPGIPPYFYMAARAGTDLAGIPPVRYRKIVTPTLLHRIAVVDTMAHATTAAHCANMELTCWHEEELLRPAEEETDKKKGGKSIPKPDQVKHSDLEEPKPVLPDGLLCFDDGEPHYFFLEIDRSSHALSVWSERALLYEEYTDPINSHMAELRDRLCLSQQHKFQPRLLIVTKKDWRKRSRRLNIMRKIKEKVGSSALFLSTTVNHLKEQSFLDSIWHNTDGHTQTLW